jgi:ABC-2 type transport system permease protein
VYGNAAVVLLLLVVGTAAFSGLGLLMAGTLRAEAILAAANLVYLLLLIGGGVIVPLSKFGEARHVLRFTPTAALSGGLRDVLTGVAGTPWADLAVLAGWAVVSIAAAARYFRWE